MTTRKSYHFWHIKLFGICWYQVHGDLNKRIKLLANSYNSSFTVLWQYSRQNITVGLICHEGSMREDLLCRVVIHHSFHSSFIISSLSDMWNPTHKCETLLLDAVFIRQQSHEHWTCWGSDHFLFSQFRKRNKSKKYYKWIMAETNGSFVLNSENSTTMAVGNTTDYPLDQTSSGEPLHEDTVSVVLIPLVIIGLLIAVAAIVSENKRSNNKTRLNNDLIHLI